MQEEKVLRSVVNNLLRRSINYRATERAMHRILFWISLARNDVWEINSCIPLQLTANLLDIFTLKTLLNVDYFLTLP